MNELWKNQTGETQEIDDFWFEFYVLIHETQRRVSHLRLFHNLVQFYFITNIFQNNCL